MADEFNFSTLSDNDLLALFRVAQASMQGIGNLSTNDPALFKRYQDLNNEMSKRNQLAASSADIDGLKSAAVNMQSWESPNKPGDAPQVTSPAVIGSAIKNKLELTGKPTNPALSRANSIPNIITRGPDAGNTLPPIGGSPPGGNLPPPDEPPDLPDRGGTGAGANRVNPYRRPSMGEFQSGIMTALRGVLGGEDKYQIKPKLMKSGALRLSIAPITEKGIGQALVTDIAPGYNTPLGPAVDILGKSKYRGTIGPEVIIGEPTEAGLKGEMPAEIHAPMQAFANYAKSAFEPVMRKYDPRGTPISRFNALLSKGNRISDEAASLPVAGGMQWLGSEETEWAQGQESSRISVSINSAWKDRNAVLESIRERIMQSRAAVQQGGSTMEQRLWASAYRYVPVIDKAGRLRMAIAGQAGEGDTITGVGTSASNIIKRMRIQPEARGPQAEMLEYDANTGRVKQARPLMIGEDIQGGSAQPDSMKVRYRGGYRVLGAPSGTTQPWVTYVQPGTVFGADIESGVNAVYTDLLKEQGIISPGAPKPIRPDLPNLTMAQLASAKWQFGQFRAIKGEDGAPTTYERVSENLPAALEPHSSTILGLLSYTNKEGLEKTVPLKYSVARTTFIRGPAELHTSEMSSASTGMGVPGVPEGGKAPTDVEPNYLLGDITQRFQAGGGGAVSAETMGKTFLEIPASTATAASIKGIVKAIISPVTKLIGEGAAGEYDQRINIALDEQSTVQRQVYGMTGALKLPDARMMGHFLAATPTVREKLVSLFGEGNPQMAEGMRRYLKFIEPKTRSFEFQGETFEGPALQTEMLGRIYAKWKGTPYQWESTTNEMFGQMRQRVEALPPREQLQRFEYMGRIPEPAGQPNMLYRGLSSWGERYAWRRSFVSTLRQQQLDENKFDIATLEGRRAYKQIYGMSPLQTVNRIMNWEPTNQRGTTSQQFPQGEPIFKRFVGGPAAFGTLVAPLITEYPGANVKLNYETIASLNAVFPETADFLGLGVNQEYLGGESPTGYTPKHIKAWREVGEVSTLLASEGKNTAPPLNYVEMDEGMRKEILAYEGDDLSELDKRIGGKGPIYDPQTKLWIERPGTVEAVSSTGFQGDMDTKTALSRWASQYPTALKGIAEGFRPKSGEGATEGERALYSLYAHRAGLFGSQRGGVMRNIASRYLASSEYMRVGAISGLPYGGIKVNRQTLDNMLKQVARYSPEMKEAGIGWRSRIDNPFDPGKQARWIDVAKRQVLEKGYFPAIMGHSPVYSRIGGTMAVPMFTDETLRKMGINYPISTMVKNGRILQGSPLTVGTFQAGPAFTVPGSDFDYDPGMIAAIAKGTTTGLGFLESGGGFNELANYFAMGPKARVREYERILNSVGGAGIVPGNEFNQLGKEAKDALGQFLDVNQGGKMPTEADTPGATSRFLASVPWSDLYHEASTVLKSGVKGSWQPYLAGQMIKSAMAGLGRGGPEAIQAESELGHFYGEYLENDTKKWRARGGPNALETIFSTTIFGQEPNSQEYKLTGKVYPTDRWSTFWHGGAAAKNIGEPMEQVIKNVMAERVSRSLAYDIGRQKNPSYHLAAYLGSVRDEDVSGLQARMEELAPEVGPEKAIYRALMGTGEGGTIAEDAYYYKNDPTTAIAPFALSLATFGKTFGWAGHKPREWADPETGLVSLSAEKIRNEPIWGMGGLNTISGLWRSRPYQIGASIYALQRNQPTHLGSQFQRIQGNLPPESYALMQSYKEELEAQGKPVPSSLAYYASQFGSSWWKTSVDDMNTKLEANRVLDIVSGKNVTSREAQEDLDNYYATHPRIHTETVTIPEEGTKLPLPKSVLRKLIHPWKQRSSTSRFGLQGSQAEPTAQPQPTTPGPTDAPTPKYVPSPESSALYAKAEMLRQAVVTARYSSAATPEQVKAIEEKSNTAWQEYKTLRDKEKVEQGIIDTPAQTTAPVATPPEESRRPATLVPPSEQIRHRQTVGNRHWTETEYTNMNEAVRASWNGGGHRVRELRTATDGKIWYRNESPSSTANRRHPFYSSNVPPNVPPVPPTSTPLAEPPQRGGEEDFWPARRDAQGRMVGMELNTKQGVPISGLFGRGGDASGEPPSDLELLGTLGRPEGKEYTLKVIQQFANTTLPNRPYQEAQVDAAMGSLNAWVGKEANINLHDTLRIRFGSIMGLSSDQSKMRELSELVSGAYTINAQEANKAYQEYKPQIQQGSKTYRAVMGAMNILGHGGVTTGLEEKNALTMGAGIAGTAEASKFGSSLTGNLSPGNQESVYNKAAPGLASAYILEKEANTLGMKTKEAFGVTQQEMKDYLDKLPAVTKELERFRSELSGLNKGSVEYKQTLAEMTKYNIEKQRMPLAQMQLKDAVAEMEAKRVSGFANVAEMEKVARNVSTATTRVQTEQSRLQALASGESPEKIAGQIAAEEGGGSAAGEAIGKMSRRLLGGFGLMYLKSIFGIATAPTQLGYQESLADQQVVQQQIGARFGGTTPLTNPEMMYQRAASMYGGVGWSGMRQLQADIIRNHPSTTGAAGMAEAGIGVGGLFATLGWMAGQPFSLPAIGTVAGIGGLAMAGVNIAGAATQDEKNSIALASQMAQGTIKSPGDYRFTAPFNFPVMGYIAQSGGRLTTKGPGLLSGTIGAGGDQGPMVATLEAMRQYQIGGGTDLRGFLQERGGTGAQQPNQYLSMYTQALASQFPNIDMGAVASAVAVQEQYNLPLSLGPTGGFSVLAQNLAQGVPWEQTALLMAQNQNLNFAQQQQVAGQIMQGWIGRQQGPTVAEQTVAERGAQRYQQLGLLAPTFTGPADYTQAQRDVAEYAKQNYTQSFMAQIERVPTTEILKDSTFQPRLNGQTLDTSTMGYVMQGVQAEAQKAYESALGPRPTGTQDITNQWTQRLGKLSDIQNMMFQTSFQHWQTRTMMGLPAGEMPDLAEYENKTWTQQEKVDVTRQNQIRAMRDTITQQVFGNFLQMGVTNPSMGFTEGMTNGQLNQFITQQQYGIGMQGTLLQGGMGGQQAQTIGGAFSLMGPQQFAQYQGFFSGNPLQQAAWMQRNPVQFSQIAQQGYLPGLGGSQINPFNMGMVNINPETGLINGLPWGTQSLATPGLTSFYQSTQPLTRTQASQAASWNMAGQIWGTNWRDRSDVSQGLIAAMAKGGTFGGQMYQQLEQAQQQQAMSGINLAMVQLQGKYQPQFWAIEDQQRALSNQQAQWGFQQQERQMGVQRTQFYENIGLNMQQSQMQRGWTQQDWQYQGQIRNLQWGWKQEDFGENLRFMTGRDRRMAERQMGRETTMHDLESEQIQKTQDRQKEMWTLEDQRFTLQMKQFEEQAALQKESLEKQREFYEQGRNLQNQMIELQRAYWKEQYALQLASAEASAKYAEANTKNAQTMLEFSQFSQIAQAEGNLFNPDTITKLAGNLAIVDPLFKSFVDEMERMIRKLGGTPWTEPNSGGGVHGRAIGGPTMPGMWNVVGENGPELLNLPQPASITSNNELMAKIYNSGSSSSWADTTIYNKQAQAQQIQRFTLPIYVGDEFLEDKVIEIVDGVIKEV